MPAKRPNETREMRLFGKVIQMSRAVLDRDLPQFIATRRMPGPNWMTWDEIRYQLTSLSGEIVTDQTLRKWAERYGIPEDTSPNGISGTPEDAYHAALERAEISLLPA